MKIFYFLITILVYSSKSVQSDITLPDTISPEVYNIVLTVSSNLTIRRFSGSVVFTFKALESVNEIWLDSRGHSQLEATVFDASSNIVANTSVTRESDDVVRFALSSQLTANETYRMILSYNGNLLLNPDGFYRSSYFINENGIERFIWQAATNFNPYSAHHAFPCYNSPQYRANFQLVIRHGSGFDSVSNAPVISRVEEPTGDVRTNFRYVNAIPPQSLAFFVMSSTEFSRQTKTLLRNGFEHILSTRTTELSKSGTFFDSLEALVTRLELFLNISMPNEFSHHHHVALPDFSEIVGAYYGFNFYREHLILFNPVISPQTKEFSIRRMIATGLLSQLLGNIVTFTSYDDAWIFNGLTMFLQYYIATTTNDVEEDFASSEKIFTNEILHPTLHQQRLLQYIPGKRDEKAACIFHMIYRAIGGKAFSMALHRLIVNNSYASITSKIFFDTLQEAHEVSSNMRFYGDLKNVTEGFMNTIDQVVVVALISNTSDSLIVFKHPVITMPINFMTFNMVKPSDIFWSERTLELIPIEPLGEDDWFLVNVDRLGFYRVNYDDTNWRRLTSAIKSQRDAFSSQTIAQLIDDSLSLARDSLVSYRTVFELLEILKNETSIIVWNAASLNLLELNNRLHDLDFYQHFAEFIHEISLHYKTIGFDDLADELMMDKFSRLQMIDFTCQMNSRECLTKMYGSLVSYLNNGKKLPVNLEASIFCYGLMEAANNDQFDYFRQLYLEMQTSRDFEYRFKIIDALGCYGDADKLFAYMETTTTNPNAARYRDQEYFPVIKSAYTKTREGIPAVIRFLSNYSRVAASRTQTPNLVDIIIADIAPRIFDDVLFEELLTMMTRLNVTKTLVESTTDIIKQNIAWKSSSSASDIGEWLENYFNPSTPTENTTTTTSTTSLSSTSTSSTTNDQTTTTTIAQTSTTTQSPVTPASANNLSILNELILISIFLFNYFTIAFFKIN